MCELNTFPLHIYPAHFCCVGWAAALIGAISTLLWTPSPAGPLPWLWGHPVVRRLRAQQTEAGPALYPRPVDNSEQKVGIAGVLVSVSHFFLLTWDETSACALLSLATRSEGGDPTSLLSGHCQGWCLLLVYFFFSLSHSQAP